MTMTPTPENIALIRNAFAVEGERRTREAQTSHAALSAELADLRASVRVALADLDAGMTAPASATLVNALGGR
jgi:hypothetical protein